MTNKMVDRRTFLQTTTAAAAATTGVASAVRSSEPGSANAASEALAAPAVMTHRHELTIAIAPRWNALDIAESLSRDIQRATADRVVVHISQDDEAGADNIARGNVNGAIGGLPEICAAPEMAIFTGLPGTMAVSPDLLLAWHDAAGGEMFLDEATAELGLKGFLVGHSGTQPGLWSNRDVSDLQAFAQSRVETVGLGPRVCAVLREAFLPTTAESEQADLTELAVPAMFAGSLLEPTKQRFWYREGLHQQGIATALVVSRGQWDKLPVSDQLIIEALARSSVHCALARNRVNDRFIAAQMMATAGAPRRASWPADISAAIQNASIETVHATLLAGPLAARAFSAYSTFFEAMMGSPMPVPSDRSTALS